MGAGHQLSSFFSDCSTLNSISSDFAAAGIECDRDYEPPTSGQRRYLVSLLYQTLDLTKRADIEKLLLLFEHVLLDLELQTKDTPQNNLHHHFERITLHLKRDGFLYGDGKIKAVGSSLPLDKLGDLAGTLDIPSLTRQIQRITDAVNDDPDLAIGTAKELTETTCKTILAERGIPYESLDLLGLVGAVRKELKLTRDDIPNGARAEKTIKNLLSNLGSVVQGLAEMRNAYGTGHGKHGRAKGLQSRHARLAIGASGALATFLLETHLERADKEATDTVSPQR